ncbi:MAG: T9SS type A sorting domain-containing protein, partial [Cyclobacteriaceae bacterium]|nr:T9SS type A sorting domain-containing protein [Cyclobacteriaceae bacterium]
YSGDAWGGSDTGLQDNTTYQYAVYAYQGDAASPETVNYNATPLTATATTLQIDNTPPVLSANNTPTLVETGTDILVDVTIEDAETGVKSVTMDYRAVESGAAYTTENMLPDGSGNYTFTIPSTSLGTLGLEYKIQAFNNAQGQATFGPYSVAVKVTNETIPYNSGGTNVSNYRIIAVPLSLTSKSVKEVFKDLPVYDAANPSEWRLFHYSGGNTKEISTGGNIELGKGYWFISKENVDISTGAGSYAAVNSGSPYVMSLSAGWNQIGNPYPFKISWSKILEQNGLTGLDLKVFVGTGYAPATILDAYQGGFVLASSAFNLNISPDKTLIGGREEDEVIPVKNPLDQNHWELTLQLTDGKIANRLSGIGMHPEAMYAYDDYDDVNLPRFIKYLDVEHETNVMGYALSKDIVPTSGHHIWEFSVLSNTEDEHISITWENSYFGTNDKELVLWDLEANKTVDMRVSNTYTFRKSATNRFKVLFGNNRFVRENLLPDAPVVLQAYPNPFNDKVSITYALPDQLQQGTINVEVYNATGTKVKTIYTGSYRSGMQQVEWDGRDDHGSRLAGGMYLIRLSTGEKSGYHRIVLR